MPADFDRCDAGDDLGCCLCDEFTKTLRIGALAPFFVFLSDVDRTLELSRPLQMRGVVMRMRNHDRLKPAFLCDEVLGSLVEERDAIPQYVAIGCLDQDTALTDGDFGFCEDTPEVLGVLDGLPFVGMG